MAYNRVKKAVIIFGQNSENLANVRRLTRHREPRRAATCLAKLVSVVIAVAVLELEVKMSKSAS